MPAADAGHLEQALDGSIFAKGAVEDGKNDIEGLAIKRGVAVDGRRRGNAERSHYGRFAVLGSDVRRRGAFEQPHRRAGGKPVSGLVDSNGHHVELLAIDCLQYRGRREQRDFMFAAPPAKQNPYAQFFCHSVSIVECESEAAEYPGSTNLVGTG